MSQTASTRKSKLLRSEGWKDCVTSELIRRNDAWQDSPVGRSHGHALRRIFDDEGLQLDAVLCTEGRPTVCVKDASALDDKEVELLRSRLWNLGAATLLVVERRHQVQVFSTFVRPANDGQHAVSILDEETIENLEATALAMRMCKLIRSVETGAIYRHHAPLFDSKQTVDQLLLSNLGALRDRICPSPSLEGYRRAHALIGRFLFSCYLLDKGIIGKGYLEKNNLFAAQDMRYLLANHLSLLSRGDVLDRLFKALQRDFNGSLFGDQDTIVADHEVDWLLRFLAGENLRTGQQSLFKMYDFAYIPVELISSIYQGFLEAETETQAKPTSRNQPKQTGQREQGAYYTPTRLAELTVDVATEGWNTLLDKRCLDGACGSGVFLVILFVRMAEEWRRRNPDASTKDRYDALRGLLANNIHGVDVNLTACLVTCFSLYLAFLDQMEPKEIEKLREALERNSQGKLLPHLLWPKGMESSKQRTIRELDFFDVKPAADFDLVIGNPPWVSRKGSEKFASARDWIFSENANAASKGLRKGDLAATLFPAKELACGFMWKASLHAKPGGRICQVLPSRVFLSNNTDRFQAHWLQHHRLETLWLLADYRFALFPGAHCPSVVARYRNRVEGEPFGPFEFVTPKVERRDPREALLTVQAEDQKALSELDIVQAARSGSAYLEWKKHHWGTPRDVRLVERLMQLPKLERLTYQPGRGQVPAGERCWARGQGFQPATASTLTKREAPAPVFWKHSDRFLDGGSEVLGLVLTMDNTTRIGNRHKDTGLLFPRHPSIYKAPLLLINQGFTKFLFSDFDVLFQDSFQSIAAPAGDADKLLFLTAVLSSPLAKYLGFHASVNMGIERDKVSFGELLQLPFPLPPDMPDSKKAEAIVKSVVSVLKKLKANLGNSSPFVDRQWLVASAKERTDAKIYDYFGVSESERWLIEDTVNVFEPSSTPATRMSETLLTAKGTTPSEREAYAEALVKTFQAWTRGERNLWATTTLAPKSGLAMLTFGVGGRAREYQEAIGDDRVEEVLRQLRDALGRGEGSVFQCQRSFAYYEGSKVHLIKPLSLRHWTRTAALNDADTIVAQMIEEESCRD